MSPMQSTPSWYSTGDNMKTIIIGGGLTGLSAAHHLSGDVTILEAQEELGGALASYHIDDYHIEKYYHHFFKGDHELEGLINELGLADRLEWRRSTTGYYLDREYPMNTPMEILQFPGLPMVDTARLALLVLRSRGIDPAELDDTPAREWVVENAGEGVYEGFFEPLLESKFGENAPRVSAAWLSSRVKLRSNRDPGGERLAYLRGGFHQLIRAMANRIRERGNQIKTSCPVEQVVVEDGRVVGVETPGGFIEGDRVLSTISPARAKEIIPGFESDIKYQGTACALFGLNERLMDSYWLNVKADAPFGAIVEHTNYMDWRDYGEHLVYVTAYFQDEDSPLWTKTREEVIEWYKDGLEELFPGARRKIKWARLTRERNTAPVYEVGYHGKILPYSSRVEGLYLAGMFSEANYPERSMEGSIRAGHTAAEIMENELKSPVDIATC